MHRSSFDKWLVTLAMVIVIAGVIFHFARPARVAREQKEKPAGIASERVGSGDFHPYYVPQVPRPANRQPGSIAALETLPRAQVEAWLAKHDRDAKSLLAAFRTLHDTNYLNEAAANFPNNPQVELAVLAHDEFPADRRKWLDLFKASSPSNSLANYLSAEDDFKNENTAAAIQELQAASGKSQFESYIIESQLEEEDLAQFCGKSPFEADTIAMTGFAEEELPQLATCKRLAQGINALEQRYFNSGDADSTANLAEMGMIFGNRLKGGDSGKYIINQLVAVAIDAIILQNLNPENHYDFLGGKTPNQVLRENRRLKQSFHQPLMEFEAVFPTLTDNEKVDYFKQEQIYGEVAAKKRVIQQHSPNNR